MKSKEDLFFEFTNKDQAVPKEHTSDLIRYFDLFTSVITESFYVMDIVENKFCYISPHGPFLCDYSTKEALLFGFDFYQKIIHPNDLSLWTDMFKAVLLYLKNHKEDWDEIDYFSCTFRLLCNYSFLPRPLPQMVYHSMKPVWENDELRYMICSVRSSAFKESGNLCLYNKDGLTYKEYNFISKRWKKKTKEQLTERERAILMLAQQGKSSVEMTNNLYRGHNTIRNLIKPLFCKLKVNSMHEAIDYACHNRIIK
jgi:Response regulator containing a CheY-like receiver domain and an HTH DNA-binding domain